jgi:esterase/lipase superfamily enzyme/TRAP-type C4-dicarboxylate transport system substrate-binding protein
VLTYAQKLGIELGYPDLLLLKLSRFPGSAVSICRCVATRKRRRITGTEFQPDNAVQGGSIMRTKTFTRCIACAVATVFAALWGASVSAKDLIFLVPADQDRATRAFIAALETSPEIRDADLTLKTVTINAVGGAGEAVKMLLAGKAQLAMFRANQIPGYQSEDKDLKFTSLLSHPLIVRDLAQQFYVEDSVVGDIVQEELGRKGFAVLGFWNAAPVSLIFNKPVMTYADLKGKKVRVPDAQSREVLQALGATATPQAMAEVYATLQQGAVDGSEVRVEEGNPYLSAIQGGSLVSSFHHAQGFFVANQTAWIGLRQRERAAIQAAATMAKRQAREMVAQSVENLPNLAKANGMTYANFAGMNGDLNAVRATWLRRIGVEGAAALGLLDQVLQRQPTLAAKPGRASTGTAQPHIFFATNRNDEGGTNLAYRFGIDRNAGPLSCGEVNYAKDQSRKFGIAYKGAIAVTTTVSDASPCAELVAKAARSNGGNLVLFIHGFNNTFDFAVRRAIAFAEDFGIVGPVLVYSWPSFGAESGYAYDMGSVIFTRAYTKGLVEALMREKDLSNISVLAHSMGSQIALQVMEFAAASQRTIDAVVLVAPDVPRDNFLQGITLHGASAKLATLYANEHDRALLLSKSVNRQSPAGLGGSDRLTMQGVETIDVSEVDQQFLELNHSHGFDVEKVADDVSLVLRRHVGAAMRNLPSAAQDGVTFWMIRP